MTVDPWGRSAFPRRSGGQGRVGQERRWTVGGEPKVAQGTSGVVLFLFFKHPRIPVCV